MEEKLRLIGEKLGQVWINGLLLTTCEATDIKFTSCFEMEIKVAMQKILFQIEAIDWNKLNRTAKWHRACMNRQKLYLKRKKLGR